MRVELVLLEHRVVGRLLTLEDDVEDRVQPVVAGEHAAQLPLLDCERMRLLAGAVEDAGDHPAGTQAPRDGASRVLARLDVQLDALSGHSGGLV